MKTYRLRIDGRPVDPAVGEWFDAQNPYIRRRGALASRAVARDVDLAVQAAHLALTSGPCAEMIATRTNGRKRTTEDAM